MEAGEQIARYAIMEDDAMFKQGLYQFIPSVKISLVSVLWALGVALVLIGVLCTTPGV